MKRDKFDELLRSKLDRIEVRPPDDMWAKLESRLPEIRRGLTMGGEEIPGPAGVLPAPKIRRPIRQKMRWAYVAASVAAVAVMVFSLSNFPDEGGMMADGTTDIPIELHPQVTVPGGTDALDPSDPVQVQGATSTVNSFVASRLTPRDPSRAGHSGQDDDRTGTSTALDDAPDGPGTTGTTDGNNIPEVSRTPFVTGSDRAPVGDGQDNRGISTEDRVWDGGMTREEWEQGRRRRSTPVSASLFAMNSAGTSNISGNVRSSYKLSNSQLIVTETDRYPDEEETATVVTRAGASSEKPKLKHDLPLSFGASVSIGILERLSLETGLTYTYMRSKGETSVGSSGATSIMTQKLHYLGIPVKLKYDFFQSRVADLYVSGGGSLETLLSGKQSQTNRSASGSVSDTGVSTSLSTGSLQGSVGANAGVNFNLDRRFGLYIEPGIGYFFENSNQPESYRTENPFNFTIKAGFRINL
ncbi:MAG: outer membrane beta-barrel protein [Rikenellaceae bacterium]|nr:outer membrane beta-barrel protein [Rikenellaceae bacterium]